MKSCKLLERICYCFHCEFQVIGLFGHVYSLLLIDTHVEPTHTFGSSLGSTLPSSVSSSLHPWQKTTQHYYNPYSYTQPDLYSQPVPSSTVSTPDLYSQPVANSPVSTPDLYSQSLTTSPISTPIFRPDQNLYPYLPNLQRDTWSYDSPPPYRPSANYAAPQFQTSAFIQPQVVVQNTSLDTSSETTNSSNSSIDVVGPGQPMNWNDNPLPSPLSEQQLMRSDESYRSIHDELAQRRQLAQEWNVFQSNEVQDDGHSVSQATQHLTRQLQREEEVTVFSDTLSEGHSEYESNSGGNNNSDQHIDRARFLQDSWNEVTSGGNYVETGANPSSISSSSSGPQSSGNAAARVPLNTVYMDTLQRLENSHKNLHEAFAEATVVDSSGNRVTTEDIINATLNDTNANDRLEIDAGPDFRTRFPNLTRELDRESKFQPIEMSDCPKPLQPETRTIRTQGTVFPPAMKTCNKLVRNAAKALVKQDLNNKSGRVRMKRCHDELSTRTNGLLEAIEEERDSARPIKKSGEQGLNEYRQEQKKRWKSSQAVVQPMRREQSSTSKPTSTMSSSSTNSRSSNRSSSATTTSTVRPTSNSTVRPTSNSTVRPTSNSTVRATSTSRPSGVSQDPVKTETSRIFGNANATVASSTQAHVFSEHNRAEENNDRPINLEDDSYQFTDTTYGTSECLCNLSKWK